MFEDDRLNPEDPDAMEAARKDMGETDQNKMTLLSGCTYVRQRGHHHRDRIHTWFSSATSLPVTSRTRKHAG